MKNFYLKLITAAYFLFGFSALQAQAPVADFEICYRVIAQYESVEITDLTSNSPYEWTWDVYDSVTYASSGFYPALSTGDVYSDPFSMGKNEFSMNPEFAFDVPGCYTVRLKAKNGSGSSVKVKKCYILVTLPTNYNLAYGAYGPKNDNHIYTDYGTIYDDGGPYLNYSNGLGVANKSFLKITPSNNQNITLKFWQIRLKDAGDSFLIYDSDTVDPSNLLGGLSASNNGQTPVFNSTGPRMYILFKTNGSGTDSGFIAEYYTMSGSPPNPNVKYTYVQTLAGQPTTFVNQYRSIQRFTYEMNWYVNDTLQTAFKDKDTFIYTFGNTNTYNVCLKASNCDTTISYCEQVNAIAGINENKLNDNNRFRIYPNPFTDRIVIEDKILEGGYSVSLFNLLGQEFANIVTETADGVQIQTNANLAAGLYLLQIRTSAGEIFTYKIQKI